MEVSSPRQLFSGLLDVPMTQAAHSLADMVAASALQALEKTDPDAYVNLYKLSRENPQLFGTLMGGIATGADFALQHFSKIVFKHASGESATLEQFGDATLGALPSAARSYLEHRPPSEIPDGHDPSEDDYRDAVGKLVHGAKDAAASLVKKPFAAIRQLFSGKEKTKKKGATRVVRNDPNAEKVARLERRNRDRLKRWARTGSPRRRHIAQLVLDGKNPLAHLREALHGNDNNEDE